MLKAARSRRSFGRWVGLALCWILVTLVAVAALNIVGVRMLGDVHAWAQWLEQHRAVLLVWRLSLYTLTIIGWCWMRKRILHREPVVATRRQLFRAELAAVVSVVALELSTFLRSS